MIWVFKFTMFPHDAIISIRLNNSYILTTQRLLLYRWCQATNEVNGFIGNVTNKSRALRLGNKMLSCHTQFVEYLPEKEWNIRYEELLRTEHTTCTFIIRLTVIKTLKAMNFVKFCLVSSKSFNNWNWNMFIFSQHMTRSLSALLYTLAGENNNEISKLVLNSTKLLF